MIGVIKQMQMEKVMSRNLKSFSDSNKSRVTHPKKKPFSKRIDCSDYLAVNCSANYYGSHEDNNRDKRYETKGIFSD